MTGSEAVLPELQPALQLAQAAPPMDFSDIAGMRVQGDAQTDAFTGLYIPDAIDVVTEEVVLETADADVAVRVHRPPSTGPRPVLVYLHGGGWILGSARASDRICRRIAERTGSLVASVDYRLAPEHRFPLPAEDCYAAVAWFAEHAADVGGDPADLVIAGQSAGGNLAAAVALMCRDRGGPTLAGQWLDVPATDLTLPDDESLRAYGHGFGLDVTNVRTTIALYAAQDDLTHPYASPLLAESLEGLPPAIITVAGCDPLRSQGERYAAALRAAGVPVRLSRWDGHLHATMALTSLHPSCQLYENEVVGALVEARALNGAVT